MWLRFVERYGALFGTGRGEIYKALDRLARAGLLELLTPPPESRSHVAYGVTATGTTTLADWLVDPLNTHETEVASARAEWPVEDADRSMEDADAHVRALAHGVVVRMRSTGEIHLLMQLLDAYEQIVTHELEKDRLPPRERAARWFERLTREAWAAELQWIFYVRAQLRRASGASVQTGRSCRC